MSTTSLTEENDATTNTDKDSSSEQLELVLVLTDTVRIHLVDTGGGEIGCKLWTAAVMLNGVLRSNPEIIQDKKVLEIGAGLGACGLCSAVLGASNTTICDCGPESMMSLSRTLAAYYQTVRSNDSDDSDDHDNNKTSPTTTASTEAATMWDALNVSLRRHLWEEDLEFLESREEGRPMDTIRHWSKNGGSEQQKDEAPMLPFDETFDVVLGSDLLYFSSQEKPLLAALQLRLRDTGVALILQTMRTNNVSVFQRFIESAQTVFQVEVQDVSPEELCRVGEQKHINETPHTTGYKLVTMTVKKD